MLVTEKGCLIETLIGYLENEMWIILFIVAVILVLGSALLLLRTAELPKIPDTAKSLPYDDDNGGDW